MIVGVPREIKVHEYRVGLTPEAAARLTALGHRVVVERGAGAGIGADDADYRATGAEIVATPDAVFEAAQLVVKVKEPQAQERARLRPGQALFTYLHIAPDPQQARDLLKSGAIAIAYEGVTSPGGGLPLLAPMSEIAGRMAVQVAAHYLQRPPGSRGVLLPGASGVTPARVVVIGAGVAGSNAARVAASMGAAVTVLDRSPEPLRRVAGNERLTTRLASPDAIGQALRQADAVIGAALVPGAVAPKVVTRAMLSAVPRGAVLVDIAIDQGGCFETSRPTTHAEPVYDLDGLLHYCVANMPGAVPRTSTYALNHVTLAFVLELADRGIAEALKANIHLRNGLTVCNGAMTSRAAAEALGHDFVEPAEALERSTVASGR